MGYRVIFLVNPAKLSTKNEQLLIDKPDNGSVRLLVITEKQYESIERIIGKLVTEEIHAPFDQLSIF